MLLRGRETTEAISQGIDIPEIATLPSVARNDRKGIYDTVSDGRIKVRMDMPGFPPHSRPGRGGVVREIVFSMR